MQTKTQSKSLLRKFLYILSSCFWAFFTGEAGLYAQTTETTGNEAVADTLPVRVKQLGQDTYEDLDLSYPFDLQNPENITTQVEYDPATGNYIIHTRMGDTDIATPFMMTESEYRDYAARKAIQEYWKEKNNTGERNNEEKFNITDMKFDIGPADKIFGPGGVRLRTQGSAELQFGFNHNYIDNPALTEKSRKNNIFDFDNKIQLNVNGKVGDKVNFNMNYNTEASFDFDQQAVKLAYKGKEDDIIQNIEAGNVSMTLNSSLITGSQALFGIKTDLQFGKLKVQAIVTQQNSESQTVSSKGGTQTTEYEIAVDNYDENRHFFLGHYFRDTYESSMSKLPHILSGITIQRIEVWVTNKRGNYDNARNIVAFMDLGESNHIDNTHWTPDASSQLPRNKANSLYNDVINLPGIRDIQQTNNILAANYEGYGIYGGEDYEKIESARLLSSSEYTLNSALGILSLQTSLNPDEVLAVAYEYTYAGQTYQVGEFSTDGIEAPNTLVVKLLKSTTQDPALASWDLMMKNVYSTGASQMQSEDFELYIMYRNDSVGTDLQYISEGDIKNKTLLKVMNLDRLDSKQNTNPDGKFDYVEGYTALSSSGRIIFPVLEPFGSHLRKAINNDAIADKYVYEELYDSTLVVAQEFSEKNKFVITGKYKGSSANEIRLNAMNVPRGSVTVTAGGATLTENVDYTVDYMMGTVKILNQSILDSNTDVNVTLENQSLFSMQRKSLFGTHVDYEFNENLVVGGTIMHLSERPLTTKVNTGSEPLSNTIWGLNTSWKTESQWLTNLIDKLPFTTATAPSTFSINAEFAQLIPGHTKEVSEAGLAYIDDFESTKTNIDLHYFNYWKLSSTPSMFPESMLSNNTQYGKNRALLSWYTIDQILNVPQNGTPSHLANDKDALSDHRVRVVKVKEIYPERQSLANEVSRLNILNLSFYPNERGPYNLDSDGMNSDGTLANPADRWGGIMRKLDVTDFETSNIEYIEFWLMDPALTNPSSTYKGGYLYFNLGDISEDILKDGKKSFEHGLPIDGSTDGTESTAWGRVPRTQSTVTAFSNETGARAAQDVGLDGLSNEDEFMFSDQNGNMTYKNYVDAINAKIDAATRAKWQDDPFSPLNDPAGDNYHFYRGSDYDNEQKSITERYKYYNNTEGNSPESDNNQDGYSTAATLSPDIEDINSDNTLNEYEKYYQYKIRIAPEAMVVGSNYITNKITSSVQLENGNTVDVDWYQFKIPINEYDDRVGSIRNFKNIRFFRLFLTGFEEETHLRLATLDLVRGEWRSYTKTLYDITNPPVSEGSLDVQAVNIEEDSRKEPVNYLLPPGITRQTDPGQVQMIEQNEQAMVLRVTNLAPGDARAVYKNTAYDMRNYKRMQMFVHTEELLDDPQGLEDYQLTCFIRLGSDMVNNYYEYEIPLVLTPAGIYSDNDANRYIVWPENNMFDFPFEVLTDAKQKRNAAKRSGTPNVANNIAYSVYDEDKPLNKITVMGNPTLGEVENIMIGIRNASNEIKSGEIWVNEMRMSEYNEEGGWAAMANAALSLSDIGQFNIAGRIETAGYGSIESNVQDRNMEDMYQLSLSAALEAGRLFPEKAKLQIPLYFSYTNETQSPKYDPLDTDIELQDVLDLYDSKHETDSIKEASQTVATSRNFTVSNAKVNIKSKKPQFYDPANFTFSYAHSEQNEHTPEIEKDMVKTQRGSISYGHTFSPKPWEPFKDSKALNKPAFRIIKDFNIYYLPQNWSFNTEMTRTFTQTVLRDFSGSNSVNDDLIFSKDFMWNRDFSIAYDLSKSIKFSLQTAMNANIEEPYFTPEIGKEYYEAWRDTVMASIAKLGTPYAYQQVFSASWALPFNKIPALDWVTANASYNSTYNWNQTATLDDENIGNVISGMGAWQADGAFNFENLYNKSKYLKFVNQRYSGRPTQNRRFTPKTYTQTISAAVGEPTVVNHRLNAEKINVTAVDKNGRNVKIKYKQTDKNTIRLTSPARMDSVLLTIVSQDPNQRTIPQQIGDMTSRFLMMIRKVSVTYRESNSLTVNGFYYEPTFMGQKRESGLYAPGYDFAFGFIDKNFMDKARNNGWLYINDSISNPSTAAYTSDFDLKITAEPLPGLKINVNGKRYIANSSTIQMLEDGKMETFTGNYNITQVAIGTAFTRMGKAADNYSSETYDTFLRYRDIMAGRLQGMYSNTKYPNSGFIKENNQLLGNQAYNSELGTIATNSSDVLIPAFLAAYTGKDINTISTNPFLQLWQILPNWTLSYDGLGKLPWLKDHFKSVSLTHGYTCKYTIGNYSSYSSWVGIEGDQNGLGFVQDVQTGNPIPSSAYDIASVSLTEQFSPLVGVNVAMKNSMTAKVEYRKQRNLTLNVSSTQLIESRNDEFVVGFGYTIKDFDVILKLNSDKQKRISNDLKLTADVSYKDIKSLLRKMEEGLTQPSSGNKVLAIRATADYVFSSKINIQLYFEHQGTTPLISTSYPVTSTDFGISFKFMLTQ